MKLYADRSDMELTVQDLKKFIVSNYLKNRTIVSSDIATIMDDVEKTTGLDVKRYRYHTGEDHGTWIVPPKWDIKDAWLKDRGGNIIASYSEHPLFVSPYSKPVHLTLTKKELMAHTVSEPKQPDAFAFNWRYAADARLRLKDWGISLPLNRLSKLDEGPFELYIDVDISDDDMLVGEIVVPGKSEDTILFIANYCHPGQVNDSFSGLAMFMKVMHVLAQREQCRYTYKLLILQETIGSAIHIAADPARLRRVKGAVFSEMVAWGKDWFIKKSRKGDSLMDLLAEECCKKFPHFKTSDFFSLVGNDEYIFDSVQVGIPTLSLQKYPFDEYHTSNDEPSRIVDADLMHASEVMLHMIDVLEKDAVYEFTVPVPFWMTRYDLYSDDQYEPDSFARNLKIVYHYLDGEKSILEIAGLVDSPFEAIYSYIKKMETNGLVKLVESCPA